MKEVQYDQTILQKKRYCEIVYCFWYPKFIVSWEPVFCIILIYKILLTSVLT